jgi:NADPH:quinone reductase-like Zn-dependent oxidoreductase
MLRAVGAEEQGRKRAAMRAVAVKEFRASPDVVEVERPVPGPGDVLVRIEAAGLNPVDWQIADGMLDGVMPHTFPLVMGVDYAGVVAETGSGVDRFAVGDRVFGQAMRPPVGAGTYAEFVAVPQDSTIAKIPDGVSSEVAAALPTSGMTAAQILETGAAVRAGESLLVIGAAGGVGSYLTQLAAAYDDRVLAVVRGDAARRMGELGAAVTIDTTRRSLEAAVRDEYPNGVDALVDLASGPEDFTSNTRLVHDGGVAPTTRQVGDGTKSPSGVEVVDFELAASARLLDSLAAAAAKGTLAVPVEARISLEDTPEAVAKSRSGGSRGKTVIVP